jgi:hypothetical protein
LDEVEASVDVIKLPTQIKRIYCQVVGINGEYAYDPSLGINIISHFVIQDQCSKEHLSNSPKCLKLHSGQILDCLGVLRAIAVKIDNPKIFLDFHVFDLPKASTHPIIIGRPIMNFFEKVPWNEWLELKIGKEYLHVSFSQSLNTRVESTPEPNPIEEVMLTTLVDMAQPSFEEESKHFSEEEDSNPPIKLKKSKNPQPSSIELKPLPPGLKCAFFHRNQETPVIISDKLSNVETQQLLTILESHRSIIGYSLQDLKGINPTLCTHRIPIDPNSTPSREPQ